MTHILALVALLLAPLTTSQAAEPPKPLDKPNVVLFLVDDLGYGDVACHGNLHVKTPQIDAFACQAAELTQFHVSPVCSPTRASLMTGRYNFRTGVADVYGKATNMDLAEVTLAERLHEAGYVSGIFGKCGQQLRPRAGRARGVGTGPGRQHAAHLANRLRSAGFFA